MASFFDLVSLLVGPNENACNDTEILFRDKEKEFLLNFMGSDDCLPYPSLFIYGHTSTGKTMLVTRIMQGFNLSHVWINCHVACSSQLVLKAIVRELSDGDSKIKALTFCDLVQFLKRTLKDRSETTYFIFDDVDVLRKEDAFLLTSLLKLQDLTGVNVCSIFISQLPWEKFRNQIISFHPICLYFPNYTKEQICEILSQDCPPDYQKNFYNGYISVIMKTFYTVTRNLSELRHLAQTYFGKYCEPISQDPDYEISSLKLWKNIEPTLREAMHSVYLREISGTTSNCKSSSVKQVTTIGTEKASSTMYCVTRQLPFYSKFLLIASYFASYNPPKTDLKHFVRNQGKQRKKKVSRKIVKSRHLLGPNSFTLDRMLSIFFSIVGERVLPSALLYSQISSLVSMRLLCRVSTDEHLDCPKYKCLAELDLVTKIAKTVSIDVMGYLDDFL
ncbi:origin recognition complex subunit 5-like [Uloborus diversus]|uniref:origin recognition complex subunit 5-like n=1 Tax=Uloborus diversus TaxID=327109 RepID=UPI0024093EE8|nr:origin recognition complex subunit 5-like [Uloborus diversus]